MNYKDAIHKTVHTYPGGPEALAPRMGYTVGLLRNKVNPNSTTNVLSADDLFSVCSITGDHSALHAFCAELGFVLTKIDEQPASDMSVFESMTGILAKFGEFSQEVHQAFADGRLEQHEMRAIDAEKWALFRQFMQFTARLSAMAEK